MGLQVPTRPKSFLNTRQMGIKNREEMERNAYLHLEVELCKSGAAFRT